MSQPSLTQQTDAALIDEALAVVREARSRAPADFMLALAVILGCGAIVLLVTGVLTTGTVQDLCFNLGTEVLGIWLTVVLIDGLWKRLQAGTSSTLDSVSDRLSQRRGSPLTDQEREAWREFVDDYRATIGATSPIDRLRSVPAFRQRLADLEARGNRTLAEFPLAARDVPWT